MEESEQGTSGVKILLLGVLPVEQGAEVEVDVDEGV